MERAESKGASAPTETAEQVNIAEAKQGAANDAAAEAKETTAEAATETAHRHVRREQTRLQAASRSSASIAGPSYKMRAQVKWRLTQVKGMTLELNQFRICSVLLLATLILWQLGLKIARSSTLMKTLLSPEEPESEEDGDDDEWVEDWTIGELTDEDLDEETMPLPDSVCLTAVRNKKTMSMMKTHR
ncbi:hypothetical protein PR003_g17677 [Phytophthora rubi]|uniref:Uncharacterized protein n=2 Tax=Phytophthora rubi TaxID=129364 RepID=A0A6A4ED96_9STRA|nr:hypothetical protein PR003_g17677 [Phytophthora rubi]